MLIRQVNDTKDILNLKKDDCITKQSLYNIIVASKEPKFLNYISPEYEIKNSPMQGINWVGDDYKPKAVIIKSKYGHYHQDSRSEYAFKAKNGYVNKSEKANQVLINQPLYHYPIYYFVEYRGYWRLLGKFQVDEVKSTSVIISPYKKEISQNDHEHNSIQQTVSQQEELKNEEKKIIETIIANRSVSPLNGKCKFIKNDGSYILADDNGKENSGLPWSGQNVKLNIFKIEDGIITDWNWEKIE